MSLSPESSARAQMDVNRYFARLGVPEASTWPLKLSSLNKIIRAHVHSVPPLSPGIRILVPYENLDIRCDIPVRHSLEDMYKKIVDRKRGGFCYELNCTFMWALSELGYKVEMVFGNSSSDDNTGLPVPPEMPGDYISEGYVRGAPGWGWKVHAMLLVTLPLTDCDDPKTVLFPSEVGKICESESRTYFVDVGFGAGHPQSALLLRHGLEQLIVATGDRHGLEQLIVTAGDRYIFEFEDGLWYQKRWDGSKWVRRIKINPKLRSFDDIAPGLAWAQMPYVFIAGFPIVAAHTDSIRRTLFNLTFTQTFLPNGNPIRIALESREKYFEVLENVFGIFITDSEKKALRFSDSR